MRAVRWFLALIILIGLGTAANGAEVPIPPSPAHWATDSTGFLAPQTVVALDARLRAYESSSGHQVLVYVAPTTGDTPTEDWTVRAFARWKVGRKGLDDGLVLFVFPNDRKVRIEVGYGLEQKVPDATAARIIRDITPQLKAGNPDAAVTAGIEEILGAVGGESRAGGDETQGKGNGNPVPRQPTAPAPDQSDSGPDPVGVVIGILLSFLIVIGVYLIVARLPRLPRGSYISGGSGGGSGLWSLLSIGGDIAGGLGGGGFSGGGGMSGGGGATGSW